MDELAFLSVFLEEPLFVLPSDSEAVAKALPVAQVEAIAFAGNYEKRLLVVVDGTDARWPESPLSEFLLKVLGAAKFGVQDIALVNWQESPKNMQQIVSEMKPAQMMAFGAGPLAQLACPLYAPNAYAQIPALAADAIAEIAADVTKKKKLWDSMKAFFKIN